MVAKRRSERANVLGLVGCEGVGKAGSLQRRLAHPPLPACSSEIMLAVRAQRISDACTLQHDRSRG